MNERSDQDGRLQKPVVRFCRSREILRAAVFTGKNVWFSNMTSPERRCVINAVRSQPSQWFHLPTKYSLIAVSRHVVYYAFILYVKRASGARVNKTYCSYFPWPKQKTTFVLPWTLSSTRRTTLQPIDLFKTHTHTHTNYMTCINLVNIFLLYYIFARRSNNKYSL